MRDLHSFPTRRSSDLLGDVVGYGASPNECCALIREHAEETLLGKDRKSTRLNSSHANISYAVFCLKKKKLEQLGVDAKLAKPGWVAWPLPGSQQDDAC